MLKAGTYSRVPIYTCSVCTIPLLHERPDQKYEILNIFNLHDTDRFTRAERKITHQIRGVLLFFWGGGWPMPCGCVSDKERREREREIRFLAHCLFLEFALIVCVRAN